jgi:hypothetical protein
MDDALFIYRNPSGARFYDAATQQMRGGPDKVIVYVNGVLCAMDREAKITIPVSRWKLAEIGLGCFLAALKRKRAVPRSLEAATSRPLIPVDEPPPAELPPELHQETSEARWEHLMREMRDLSP